MDLKNLPDISFVDKDVNQILEDMVKGYEDAHFEATGERIKLYPGDKRRIFLYSQALREYQLRQLIDFSAKQNLLKYAKGDYLDHLAARRGITRKEATKAKTTIRFVLSAPQSVDTTIPSETRVSPGNEIFFETTDNLVVPAGELEITGLVECQESGTVGNGFSPGQINLLVDPLPFIESVENIDTSQGGADKEDDDSFRERIWLAPEGFSTAGPEEAYIFHTKSYSSQIADVQVTSPVPGEISINVLLENGEIPEATLLSELEGYLNDKKIRPLTDKLVVNAPVVVNYDINIEYYISSDDQNNVTVIQKKVNEAVQEYILWQKSKISRDINPDELISRIISAGAKRTAITSPTFQTLGDGEVAQELNVNVVYGGIEDA